MDWAQHLPGSFLNFGENADVAADHYHRFREDLDLAKDMKFTSHRFSISWSRVLPTGGTDNVNEEGVKFYKDYIDKVISNGMEPMVTMLHFDQPLTVEKATGGWAYPEMIDKYVKYAEFLFQTFGDKVKYWNTINEPNMYCNYFGVFSSLITPGTVPKEENQFHRCLHNIILAHMRSYKLYKEKYEPTQNGKVGTSVLMWPAVPNTTQSQDVMAAETFNQVFAGTLLHPLVFGDYPPIVRYLAGIRDKEDANSEPLLPQFTAEEKAILAGGVTDFIALNLYSACNIRYNANASASGGKMATLLGPVMKEMPFVEVIGLGDFSQVDESLMKNALIWTWGTYHVPIIIAENGYADTKHAGVNDTARAAYHSTNLRSLVRTVKEYGVEVLAYYIWSLLDVFEFTAGYSQRPFGLIHVDYKTGSLNRTLKASAQFFIELNETGRVPYVPVPGEGTASLSTTSFVTTELLLVTVWVAIAQGL
ncbi:Beta-glucosidase 42 [Frankliniella fusca]|uniref:Beta-glucosidase 42 n=1 Tax=Frankliniella fusca TaxID=407009 RepID=A0AAE1I393_9NEOP|nr:Beta-glucosidase 42 [Frankliniella fusca]